MEQIEIKKEYNKENGETIYNHREYNIKIENNNYILRLEIDEQNIYFIISINDNIVYNYKTKMNLSTIVNKLELNQIKYSNLELILNLFDKIYENKKILININNDESCILIIKIINAFVEEKYEIKLYKKYININDKFNLLFNQIKILKNVNNNIDEIEKMNNKINELNNKIDKKDEEIKNIINKNNIIINETNKKVLDQEIKIKELENKNIDLKNKYEKKLDELFNKHENEIKILNNKLSDLENNINNRFNNEIIQNYNNMKEEINKLNNKIQEIENNKNDIDDKIKNNILNEMNKIENKIDIKFKEQENNNENKIKRIIHELEYEKKMNYNFIKDPKNLKYKLDITTTNTDYGWNDIFEIYISYIDNKEYLVSPNTNNFNLDIFELINNQKINSLQGHKNHIRTIRYFINNKNKNEYLISADDNKIVIIWDITNNYNIKYNIDTKYGGSIYSCLLIFPNNMNDDYIITSSYNKSKNNEDSATKIYSFNDCKFIKYINNTNNNSIYYLLSWYNKKNNKYYIIQFSYKKILINNLLEDELYSELSNEPETNHFSGFIYYKDNNDYLCSSSGNGYINIWDLYNKKIFKVINTNGCKLAHIIEWNNKYIIVADYNNKLFKIIDIDNNSIHDIKIEHKDNLACIKKINHPIYGESLLSAGNDKIIKLWTIE